MVTFIIYKPCCLAAPLLTPAHLHTAKRASRIEKEGEAGGKNTEEETRKALTLLNLWMLPAFKGPHYAKFNLTQLSNNEKDFWQWSRPWKKIPCHFFFFFALPAPLSRTCLLDFCEAAHWYIASVSVRLAKTPTARCSFCRVFDLFLTWCQTKYFFSVRR